MRDTPSIATGVIDAQKHASLPIMSGRVAKHFYVGTAPRPPNFERSLLTVIPTLAWAWLLHEQALWLARAIAPDTARTVYLPAVVTVLVDRRQEMR